MLKEVIFINKSRKTKGGSVKIIVLLSSFVLITLVFCIASQLGYRSDSAVDEEVQAVMGVMPQDDDDDFRDLSSEVIYANQQRLNETVSTTDAPDSHNAQDADEKAGAVGQVAVEQQQTDVTQQVSSEEQTNSLVDSGNDIIIPDGGENTQKKLVAITFDDGPTKNTEEVLDLLNKYGAKATFFMLGVNIGGREETVLRMHNEGHELGNHTQGHLDLIKQSVLGVKEQINLTENLIADITGKKTVLMRPPYGSYNDAVLGAMTETGYAVMLWDVDPRDWKYRDATVVSNHILSNVQDGSIVLLHDDHNTSVTAAEIVLQTLTQQGYEFVTITELLTRNGDPVIAGKPYRACYPSVDDVQ